MVNLLKNKLYKMQYQYTYIYILIAFLLSGLYSCTGTKRLADGQSLYTGAELKTTTREKGGKITKEVESELEELIQPEPNFSIFGSRPLVWIHQIIDKPEKEKGLKYWLRTKVGNPPVLFAEVRPDRVATSLQNSLFNNGYFDAEVNYEVKTSKNNKTTHVNYLSTTAAPYQVEEIVYPEDSGALGILINKSKIESKLKPGMRFDVDKLNEEFDRIEAYLKNEGYYYFDARYLLFEADTTIGNKKAKLYLKVEENAPEQVSSRYSINQIKVVPSYSLNDDSLMTGNRLKVDSMIYIDDENEFRPEIITNTIQLQPGKLYSKNAYDLTLNRLTGLGTFKFVNVRFDEADSANHLLNTEVLLTPLKRKSIRAQLEFASKSSNFVGPALDLSFIHRNLFRGAERLDVTLNTGFETQISGQQTSPLNSFEIGLHGKLTVPRFITPFNIRSRTIRFIPQTEFILGFRVLSRVNFFRLNSFDASLGYVWKERLGIKHEFRPIDIIFVQLADTDSAFQEILNNNPVLARSYEEQFILGGNYSYTYNSRSKTGSEKKTHNFYFNGNADISGNLAHLLQSSIRNGENPADSSLQLFGQPYSQFAKGDVDFRHYYRIDQNNSLVTRLFAGMAYPYGNSETVPYIKQYASGGSNSLRAFLARSVGPGSFNTDSLRETNTTFIDQTGEIKLEGNVEYRFDIIGSLKGAVFVDAGNIWLVNQDSSRVGGKFETSDFLSEVAMGTGVGLRFDTNFFVIRLDVAMPIRKPSLPREDRWTFDQIDFGDKEWRKNNLTWNIAIGYPF